MIQSVHDLIAERFGVSVETREFPDALDADTTSKVLARRNARRVGLIVINLSANTVVVAPFPGVTTTRGIQVAASGGSLILSALEDFDLPAREWHVVASVDNSSIYVAEVVIGSGVAQGAK